MSTKTSKQAVRRNSVFDEESMKTLLTRIFTATLQAAPELEFNFEVRRDCEEDLGFSFVVFNVDTEIEEHGLANLTVFGGLIDPSIERQTVIILDVLSGEITVNQFAKKLKEGV